MNMSICFFRKFKLVVVRHGEATHNLPDFKAEDLVLTGDAQSRKKRKLSG